MKRPSCWLSRHDNLPKGCLAQHLDRIITSPAGVESAYLERRTVVTLWFIAYAMAAIGLCVWVLLKSSIAT